MPKKTILMTGASGLVGSRFVEMFPEYEIANMDLTTGVDITDKATIAKFVREHPSSVMIHLAAFTNTNEAFKQAGDTAGMCYKVNVEGTRNIADVCKENDIFLIHISTDFVFDGTKETPYSEDDARHPIEWYGETKAIAEEVVEKSGAAYAIARLAYPYRAVYGLKPDIVAKIRSGLEAGTLYPQFSDTVITPTFIDDIARGFAALAEEKKQGIFHLTGATALSPYELARRVAAAYGYDPAVVKEGSLTEYLKTNPRPFARYAAMSNEKSCRELGITFASMEQGLVEIKKQQGA